MSQLKKILILLMLAGMYKTCLPADYGCFIENSGQWDEQVHYLFRSGGRNIWITDSTLVFDDFSYDQKAGKINGHVYDLSLSGSNFHIAAISEIKTKYNFFFGNDKTKWVKNVSSYDSLEMRNIYDNIDMYLYADNHNLRYDFVIRPGASPDDISIRIRGCDYYEAGTDGELIIGTSLGEVVHHKINAFQEINGETVPVACRFIQKQGCVGLETGGFDSAKPLIIDPLVYSTYMGGSKFDQSEAIASDNGGNVYIAGQTASPDFPVTDGAYSRDLKKSTLNHSDIFVSKFDSTGKGLIFSTYIGGSADDIAQGIDIDTAGNVFITGYAGSSLSFPVTSGAYDTVSNGGYDAFVIKLSSEGDSLQYSTWIGGIYDDFAMGIDIDRAGSAYITGYTTEKGQYPVTNQAYMKTQSGAYDAFVTKLVPDGSSLIYSTYLAGIDDDFGNDISVDPTGKAYITGTTRSADYPVTPDAMDKSYHDTANGDNHGDIFITVLDPSGSAPVYSSYIGGSDKDAAYAITTDSEGNVYIAGTSESADYPVTSGAYDTSYNSYAVNSGLGDVVVTKLDAVDFQPVFSTYIGGAGTDRAFDIKLDKYNDCCLTGSTGSFDLPVTKNAFDTSFNDNTNGSDAFVMRLSADGKTLSYCTYVGGSASDVGNAVTVFDDMSIGITGTTSSGDFPLSDNPFDRNYTDTVGSEAFLLRVMPSTLDFNTYRTEIKLCEGSAAEIGQFASGGRGSVQYNWSPSAGLSNVDTPIVTASPGQSISYTLTAKDESGDEVKTIYIIEVIPLPDVNIYGQKNVRVNADYTYTADENADYTYRWDIIGGGILSGQGTNALVVRWTALKTGVLKLVVTAPTGCSDSVDNFTVTIGENVNTEIIIYGSTEFCEGDSVLLDAGDGYESYLWNNGSVTQRIIARESGDYWVKTVDSDGSGLYSDTVRITVKPAPPKPVIKVGPDYLECLLDDVSYQWFYGKFRIPGADSARYYFKVSGWYQVQVKNQDGCTDISDSVFVTEVKEFHDQGLVKVYPNPAEDLIHIDISPDAVLPVDLKLRDIFGNVIRELNPGYGDKTGNYTISTAGLASGYYILVINTGDEVRFMNVYIIK